MTAQEAVAFLATKRRIVLLGGMAMILHGLSRNTKDYDIWLDPLPDAQTWAAAIQRLLTREPPLQGRSHPEAMVLVSCVVLSPLEPFFG